MSGALAVEGAVSRGAILRSPEALESFLDDGRIFPVVIGVHLDVGRADVHLVASILHFEVGRTYACVLFVSTVQTDNGGIGSYLDAVVVRLFAIVRTSAVAIVAVIAWRVTHESVLE